MNSVDIVRTASSSTLAADHKQSTDKKSPIRRPLHPKSELPLGQTESRQHSEDDSSEDLTGRLVTPWLGDPDRLDQILEDRIRRGPTVVKREPMTDGRERITYKNFLP